VGSGRVDDPGCVGDAGWPGRNLRATLIKTHLASPSQVYL
jgi:hypothetical protein